MYWISFPVMSPVVQFGLGGVFGLIALLTAALPAWLVAREHLARGRRPRPTPRAILVRTLLALPPLPGGDKPRDYTATRRAA